jgi:hypothetical protein
LHYGSEERKRPEKKQFYPYVSKKKNGDKEIVKIYNQYR